MLISSDLLLHSQASKLLSPSSTAVRHQLKTTILSAAPEQ
jgi:hypothetical protein